MYTGKKKRMLGAAILALGAYWSFLDGCAANIQRELEVLAAPQSSATLINDSVLVDWFGPQVIKYFQDWW